METLTDVRGADLTVGDVVVGLGGKPARTLTHTDPYNGDLAYMWDGHARVGEFDGHWRITLEPDAIYRVVGR